MKIQIPLNIPNVLSLYRLLSFPFVLYLAVAGYEGLFTVFLCINLVTDILDGLIARAFNMMTAIGAKLDSLADLGTYILAFIGVYCFRSEAFQSHILSGSLFLGFFVLSYVVAYIKFKKLLSLHLYSAKIGAYMQGTFFFVLFAFDFNTKLYYVMVVWSILSSIEEICVQLLLKDMKPNAKGLYWVLKK